jgi:hypothetical protein
MESTTNQSTSTSSPHVEPNHAVNEAVQPIVPPPDLEVAKHFLKMLDEEAETFCFRAIPAERSAARHAHNLAGALDDPDFAAQLVALNNDNYGIFVVVNRGGQDAGSINRARSVFADFDGTPLPPRFDLEPHALIETSPGRHHAYWFVDDLPVAEFTPVQQAIAEKFGSDANVKDLSRVMRLPGFIHRKRSSDGTLTAPFLSRIIHESGTLPYPGAGILAAFPRATGNATARVRDTGALVLPDEKIRELRSALTFLRSDEYAVWIAVGSALSELGDVGRGLWLEWSQASSKYDATDAARTWESLRHDRTGYRAVFARAYKAGWTPPPMSAEDLAIIEALALSFSGPAPETAFARPPERALRIVELGDVLSASIAPPKHVVSQLIPRGEPTLVGAHGGAGKTTFMATLGAHVANAWSGDMIPPFWSGFELEPGKVVFVSLEDTAEQVRAKVRRAVEAYYLDAARVADNFVILDGSGTDSALAKEVLRHGKTDLEFTRAMMELEAAAEGASLIIIDNASDAFEANEISRPLVRTFMRRLKHIARENDCGMALLAHIDKDSAKYGSRGNSYSGSTAWHNSARSRLSLIPGDDGTVELHHEKANLGPRAKSVRLSFNQHGILLPCNEREEATDNDSALLRCLTDAISAGEKISTAKAGVSNAFKVAKNLPGYPTSLKGADQFWKALHRLEREKKLVREEYTNHDHKRREKWSIPPIPPIAADEGTGATGGSAGSPPADRAGGMGETAGGGGLAAERVDLPWLVRSSPTIGGMQ